MTSDLPENKVSRSRSHFNGEARRELNAALRWKDAQSVPARRVVRPSSSEGPRRVVKFTPYEEYEGDFAMYKEYLADYYVTTRDGIEDARKNAMSHVLFESRVIKLFIGHLLRTGGKSAAIRIFRAFLLALLKSNFYVSGNYRSPLHVLFKAVQLVSPRVVLCSKRVGGVVYRLPIFIARDRRSYSSGIRWIIQAARERSGGPMSSRLVSEICDLFEKKGLAYKWKTELYGIAVSNKPFIHYLRRKGRRGRLLARLNRK